ncbi:MAG: glycosyltransferase family 2 protein [Bacteroidia bacterium]|nr:glycosyltransferase family 2 protein [Bacteroidia bacterium]
MSELSIDKSRIVIVIPTYNEGDRLERVVNAIQKLGYHKIVVVDDNSVDGSVNNLRSKEVIVLQHVLNRGSGASTETGLSFVRETMDFDALITIDADTQHDPTDIDILLKEHFRQEADLTIGNRFMSDSNDIPDKTKFYNGIANITTSIICGKRVYDSQSGFKVFSRSAIKQIELNQDRFAHCSEALIKAHRLGLKVIDVPIKVYYPVEIRDKGQNLVNGIKTFINLIQNMLFKNN